MLEYERIISFCEFFTIKYMLTIENKYDIIGKDGHLLQNGVDRRLSSLHYLIDIYIVIVYI